MKATGKITKTELDLQHETPVLASRSGAGFFVSTYPISAGIWSPEEKKERKKKKRSRVSVDVCRERGARLEVSFKRLIPCLSLSVCSRGL